MRKIRYITIVHFSSKTLDTDNVSGQNIKNLHYYLYPLNIAINNNMFYS